MQKYFDLVLDLLELEEKEQLCKLAKVIEKAQKEGQHICFAHRYAFLLKGWFALLSGELTPEAFVQLWDLGSELPLIPTNQKTSKQLIQEFKDWFFPQEELCIIDGLAWKLLLTDVEQKTLLQTFSEQKKVIIGI